MGKIPQNQDITIRGGIINVPHSTTPTHPPRHQPDTPRNKKHTTTRSDHVHAPTHPPPAPPPPPDEPPENPTSEPPTPPEGSNNEPTPTSQSD